MQPLCSDRHWYNNAAGSELTISPNFSIRESVIESVLRFLLLFPLKIRNSFEIAADVVNVQGITQQFTLPACTP